MKSEAKSPRDPSNGTPTISLDDDELNKNVKDKKKRTRTLGSPFGQTKEKGRKASSLEYKSPKAIIFESNNNPRRITATDDKKLSNDKRTVNNNDVIKSGWVIVNKTNSFCELVKSGWEVKLRCFSKILVTMVRFLSFFLFIFFCFNSSYFLSHSGGSLSARDDPTVVQVFQDR
jgi:hypothetical protein